MWIILAIVAVLIAVAWGGGLLMRSGENLTIYDGPVEPSATESFGRSEGPSEGHRGAEAQIAALAPQARGLSGRERLAFIRQFMEEMPAGKQIEAEFNPVTVNGVPCQWVLAPGVDQNRRVLYIHGGAFIAGSPNSHRVASSRFSAVANAAVLAVDYRLMPENRRIEGIEDCRNAYRWILENGPSGPAPASRVFMGGDSAGGNLSLSTAAWIRDQGMRAPDAVVAMSPLTDSTYSSPYIKANLSSDTMLGPLFGALTRVPTPLLSWIFLAENRMLPINPLVSPVQGDLSGLPPTLVQASESEMLYGDAVRYVNKARAAGSPVRLQSWAGLLHVWQLFYPEAPEAAEAWQKTAEFIAAAEAAQA